MSETSRGTPNGVIVTATKPDGTTLDITEGVQALYDLVIQSMDWGSGFLSLEEVVPVERVATFCGFAGFDAAQAYVADEMHREEADAYCRDNPLAMRYEPGWASGGGMPGHEHAWSSVGRCMWRYCDAKEDGRV